MENLVKMSCVPVQHGDPPLTDVRIAELLEQLPDWAIAEREGVRRLERTFRFSDFSQALTFTNLVGEVAEKENHHPAILLRWGGATVAWRTYQIQGFHRNDFVMAAKTDALVRSGA